MEYCPNGLRHDVRIVTSKLKDDKHSNVYITAIGSNFIAFKDNDGKEHIYTGNVEIHAEEV